MAQFPKIYLKCTKRIIIPEKWWAKRSHMLAKLSKQKSNVQDTRVTNFVNSMRDGRKKHIRSFLRFHKRKMILVCNRTYIWRLFFSDRNFSFKNNSIQNESFWHQTHKKNLETVQHGISQKKYFTLNYIFIIIIYILHTYPSDEHLKTASQRNYN